MPVGTRGRNGCFSQYSPLCQVGKQGQAEPLAETRCVGAGDGVCTIWQFLLAQHWHPGQEPFRRGIQTARLAGDMGITLLEADYLALLFG